MRYGRRVSAHVAQVLAQVLTLWIAFNLLVQTSWVALAVVAIAFAVPCRSNGTMRDRAVSNFAAGLLMWGMLVTRLLGHFLDTIIWGPGDTVLTTYNLVLLTMTVLYTFAGAFFWLERERDTE